MALASLVSRIFLETSGHISFYIQYLFYISTLGVQHKMTQMFGGMFVFQRNTAFKDFLRKKGREHLCSSCSK